MFSVRGPKLKYFALVMAVIAIAGGVYITFFQMAGFAKTQATIVSIVEDEAHSTPDDVSYIVTVDYVVNDEIVGGIIVFDGDKVYDGSVAKQLDVLRERIKGNKQ